MAAQGKAYQRTPSSVLYISIYLILVMLGNIGNTTVIGVVGEGLLRDTGVIRSSDVILVNMAFSSLMVSLVRNTVVMVSDLGVEVCRTSLMDERLVGCITVNEWMDVEVWRWDSGLGSISRQTTEMSVNPV